MGATIRRSGSSISGANVTTQTLSGNIALAGMSGDYFLDAAGGTWDATLPTGVSGMSFYVKNRGTGTVRVKTAGGTLLRALTSGLAVWYEHDGTDWRERTL